MNNRYLLLVATLIASLACCKGTSFSRGEPIRLGPYSLTINYAETEQDSEGRMKLTVHFRFVQVEAVERRFRAVDGGPRPPRFTVADSEGREYRFQSMRSGTDSEDWVASFIVPAEGRGFSAVINNPSPRAGQPCVATVPLGR